jgi:hypothetical protein
MNKSGLMQTPSEFGRRNRRQRKVMADMGLPDFETPQQCSGRQRLMARRFDRAGELQHETDWQECEPDFCATAPCRDGCWFSSRRHRYEMITESHRLLSGRSDDLLFVTITHPKGELAVGRSPTPTSPQCPAWQPRRTPFIDHQRC